MNISKKSKKNLINMAKATLKFNLDDPSDEEAHRRAVKSLDLCLALWDIDQYLRSQTKYNEQLTQDAYDALEKARKEFYEILNKRNISIDELMS